MPTNGRFIGMTTVTTIKVSTATHAELKALADRDAVTLDEALRKLLKAERQRQLGIELASRDTNADDTAWIQGTTAAVQRAIG